MRLKGLILSLDLIIPGKEFHTKIDDVLLKRFYPLLFFCCTWGGALLCSHNARILLIWHLQGLTYCIDNDILGIAPVDIFKDN